MYKRGKDNQQERAEHTRNNTLLQAQRQSKLRDRLITLVPGTTTKH